MAVTPLDFEKPVLELEDKIAELKRFGAEKGLDLSQEIETLENKSRELKRAIYANLTPWQRTMIARHGDRPNTLDYIRLICEDFLELHGDRCFGDDAAVVGGIAFFQGMPVTLIGHVRGKDTKDNLARNFGMPHPEGLRKAMRLMLQAEKFSRPVISFIDTQGAYCGIGAEERGQAEAIARCLCLMSGLRVPVVSVIIGEGGSGGALALAVADRLLMLENAIFSVCSPEACASILWKDGTRAPAAAESLRLTAADLYQLKLVDEIVPEPLGGAHRDVKQMAETVKQALAANLEAIMRIPVEDLLAGRYQKYRRIGVFLEGQNTPDSDVTG